MESIQSTVIDFLLAFSRLDLNGMMACFEDDATCYFPVAHHLVMLNGKKEIRAAYGKLLESIRESGKKSIKMEPEDVKIKHLGDTAIVTFHTRDDVMSRRTLVLRREEKKWLIQHLHSSNAPLGEPN